MKLFGRRAILTVGDRSFDDLDFVFRVRKTLKAEPNTATIRIFNLSDDNRRRIEQPQGPLAVRLEAGYEEGVSQLYLGEMRAGFSTVDGPDVVTEIQTGDKKAIAKARLSVPVGPKQPLSSVLSAIAKALGAGAGNTAAMAAALASKGSFHAKGGVLVGSAARAMTDLCRSAGLEWSIQDGNLQILDVGKPLETARAVVLSADSGLIGSPTVDSEGKLECQCLLIPGIRPGVKLVFESLALPPSAGYRITEVDFLGDTRGNDWTAKIHAEKY